VSGGPTNESVIRILRLLADALERTLEGDETALEALGESIELAGGTSEDLEAAALVLRGVCAEGASGTSDAAIQAPGGQTQRVLSAHERAIVTPEAWGYLLRLQSQGSIDAEQLERVLDLVAGSGVRPVGIEEIRAAALRVAMTVEEAGLGEAEVEGPFGLSH
jgi:hypothetical protein